MRLNHMKVPLSEVRAKIPLPLRYKGIILRIVEMELSKTFEVLFLIIDSNVLPILTIAFGCVL